MSSERPHLKLALTVLPSTSPHFSLTQRTPGKYEGGLMSRELPKKPNLEHLKKQAKDLLHEAQQGDAAGTAK